jgi:putative transposase
VLHITTDLPARVELARSSEKKKQSLKQHLLDKMKTWINSLLEGERDEFLGRDRHVPLDEGHDNYRNGYRPRRINFFGLGEIELKVPRDRQGEFTSQWLPERKGQDPELPAIVMKPAMLAAIDVQQHAGQGPPWSPLPVHPALASTGNQSRPLQHPFDPALSSISCSASSFS